MGEFGGDIFGIQGEPPTVALESQAELLEKENCDRCVCQLAALIPAVDQIDDQFDHRLLIRRFAFRDHQRDSHQCIVGDPLRSILSVKHLVARQEGNEQGVFYCRR